MHITNKEGKELFKVIKTQSNSMKAVVLTQTWDEAIKWINGFKDGDSTQWYRKIISKTVNENYSAVLEFTESHKGLDYNYLVRIEVSPLCYF